MTECNEAMLAAPSGDLKCLYLTSRAGDRVLASIAPGFAVDLKALAGALGLARLSVAGARVVRDELGLAPPDLSLRAVIEAGDPSVIVVVDAACTAETGSLRDAFTARGFTVHVCDIAAPMRARREQRLRAGR